jgi:HK97 family phage major capsid protein
VVALDAALRDRLVLDVASKLDAALIAGSGDIVLDKRATPLGIQSYVGSQGIAVNGTLSIDHVHDAVGAAMAANVETSRLRWLMRSEVFVDLRKIKDSSGNAY